MAWTPVRTMSPTGQISVASGDAARMATAWGQTGQAAAHLSDAYRRGFTARAMGEPLSERDWSAVAAGSPTGAHVLRPEPWMGTWSPYPVPGPVDLDALAERAVRDLFGGGSVGGVRRVHTGVDWLSVPVLFESGGRRRTVGVLPQDWVALEDGEVFEMVWSQGPSDPWQRVNALLARSVHSP